MKTLVYDHYRTATIKPNTSAADRAAYWKGRFGYTVREAMLTRCSLVYNCWAAGHDLFVEQGLPDIEVQTPFGKMTSPQH